MKIKIQYILSALVLSLTLSYGTFAQTTTQSQKFGANPTLIAPSAVLEIESTNKGVLFPRVTLSSTSDLTTIASPATGLTVFNTASAGTSPSNVTPGYYYWDGSKWVKIAIETPPVDFAKTVYVNAASPASATIFDENNPPATNDNALKTTDVNLYIGNNGSTWTYNTSTSTYNTFIVPASTPFNLAGTTTDAGNNKTGAIERAGSVSVTNGFLRASGSSNSFTMDPTQGGGPRLMLGPTATPNGFFELGAYNGMNNFDTKARDFNIFSTASANALYLKHNTGNIGINTNAPTQRLDVNGTGLFRRGNSTGATNFNQILFGFNGESTYQHAIKTRHTGGTAQGNAIDFYVWTSAVGLNTVASQHLMSLEGQGRVGIGGITNPTAVIDAASTSLATTDVNVLRKMLRLSIPTNPSVKVGNVAEFNMGSYATGGAALTRLDLALNNAGDNTVSQVMTWQANGNVGIGTAAPEGRLHVLFPTGGDQPIWERTNSGGGSVQAASGQYLLNNLGTTLASQPTNEIGTGFSFAFKSNTEAAKTVAAIVGGLTNYAAGTGTLSFRVNGATNGGIIAMRINSDGNVGIGTDNTAPTQRLQVVGNIAASGTVSASGTTLTSDARLKSNVVRIKNGLTTIMQLNPVNYDKKIALDSAATANENGFIAQELQKIMPELVSEGKDNDKLLSINYTAIIPVLTKAVQEQQAIIEKQQMQINELKALLEKVLNDK